MVEMVVEELDSWKGETKIVESKRDLLYTLLSNDLGLARA